jgi:hypothetical protein
MKIVYHRIKWDSSFRTEEFIIGYEDRFIGIKEVQFDDFHAQDVTSETFIPWYCLFVLFCFVLFIHVIFCFCRFFFFCFGLFCFLIV